MFTIEVSIYKDDLPSYSREIDVAQVSVVRLFDAADVLHTIRSSMERLEDQYPVPQPVPDKLQAAKDLVCEFGKSDMADFESWMAEA